MTSTLAVQLPAQALSTGAMTGLTYAVLAAGLVLVFRATRVVNFAHGDTGAFGALVLGKLVADQHWPYLAALPVALAVGGLTSAFMELVVVRRLFHAPRLVLLVATIGLSQVLFAATLLTFHIRNATTFPVPFDRELHIGSVRLLPPELLALVVIPPLIVFVSRFLSRTPHGIAIRASAENTDAALLAGISVKRVSTTVWSIAGVLAVATVIVYNPLRNPSLGLPTAAFGPSLMLRALAAALVGRMQSLPLALAGGLSLGVVEAVLLVNFGDPGLVNLVFAGVVVVLVLLRGTGSADDAQSIVPPSSRARGADTAASRTIRRGTVATAVVVAITLPLVFSASSQLSLLSQVAIFAVIGLSVTLLTGWAGLLSLGQYAFVGVGAVGTLALVNRGVPFGVAIAYSCVAAVLLGLLVGWPALRVGGLFLAVTTLGFAIAVDSWVLRRPELVGTSAVATLPRGRLGPIDLHSERTYYYLCVLVLFAAVAVIAHLRQTGIGRTLIAVRENERSAAAFTVSPARAKLSAFAVAAALAAAAGGLLAGLTVQIRVDAFNPALSLQVVAMTIIGGLGSVGGAVLGAVWMLGVPALLGDSAEVRALTSGLGLLVLLLYLPGGLISVLHRARDIAVAALARRPGRAAALAVSPAPTTAVPVPREPAAATTRPALAVEGITVRFGGRRAVDDVTLEMAAGSVVGLIGSNGAGKTTLMNAISGFVPAAGRVFVDGRDVTSMPTHERARAGLGRAFQNARLFGDLTVRETLQVALESEHRSELVPSLLGLPPSVRAERAKRARADELVDLVGMGRYADTPVRALSTGTRRIAELACLLALSPRVLLLDEPTAGVAQRETEAFGPLISRIRAELDATVVIIEHDMPLVMSISDVVHCLEQGAVIASGDPHSVRHDPRVVASYLGTDERAIARSGLVAAP
jgi:ABC-type branched-subunit amino acid transport system ATPase component/ABC-type branched-subunit amino acid transport system permease subunit